MQLIRMFCSGQLTTTVFHKLRQTPLKPFKCYCTRAVDVNTNVLKDVILYKHTNQRFYKVMNIFAVCQFGFWSYLSAFAYTSLRDAPVDKSASTSWWNKINLGDNKYRNGITLFSFIVGFGILSITWIYTLRSVKYLILHKGGKELTIVTYAPFGENRMFKLDLKNVSCSQTRSSAGSQLPIKVKGHSFHYMVDMKGEFRNSLLFDNTVALKRNLK